MFHDYRQTLIYAMYSIQLSNIFWVSFVFPCPKLVVLKIPQSLKKLYYWKFFHFPEAHVFVSVCRYIHARECAHKCKHWGAKSPYLCCCNDILSRRAKPSNKNGSTSSFKLSKGLFQVLTKCSVAQCMFSAWRNWTLLQHLRVQCNFFPLSLYPVSLPNAFFSVLWTQIFFGLLSIYPCVGDQTLQYSWFEFPTLHEEGTWALKGRKVHWR